MVNTPIPSLATDRLRVNARWLLNLRWAAVAGQLVTVLFVKYGLNIDTPITALVGLICVSAVTNVLFALLFRQYLVDQLAQGSVELANRLLAVIIGLDILLLSSLLYFTGGPYNPFSIFYLLNLALAAVVLAPRDTWVLNVLAIACYSGLLVFHRPYLFEELKPIMAAPPATFTPANARDAESLRMAGLLMAFGTVATLMVYFVTRVTSELSRRDMELAEARESQSQSEKLEALATLAAGAAHELSTPLSTIAVVARELEVDLDERCAEAEILSDAVADVRLIRKEVNRCRQILHQMAADAGESMGEVPQPTRMMDLVADAVAALVEPWQVHIQLPEAFGEAEVFVPRTAVAQVLRGLLQNGIDASPSKSLVVVTGDWIRATASSGPYLQLQVTDTGTGMSDEVLARATQPFFTTKEVGRGMGLGLFLAMKVMERLGGTLQLTSAVGVGTTATIRLPTNSQPPGDKSNRTAE